MKRFGLGLVCLCAFLMPAAAQVTVEITMDQNQYLPAESIPLVIRITNRSGQSLRLGQDADWMTFTVESQRNEVVPKVAELRVGQEFELGSSRVATLRADLAPYFLLTRSGRFTVTATVRINDWNQNVRSQPKSFDIIEGAKLWEQEIGVPDSGGGTNAVPEVRKFILQQANYLKSQLRLYVRLTDASGDKTFRVFPLGQMVSFGRPDSQVDKFSNLHVLCQEGPRGFNYTVINANGEVIVRRTYDYVDKRPRLNPDTDGKVLVVGGVRRPTAKDVPPYNPEAEGEKKSKAASAPGEIMLP